MLALAHVVQAAPPDQINGGVPDTVRTSNLGPTGMRGWIYHRNDGGRKADTSESRQILIVNVANGSPAHGVIAKARTKIMASYPDAARRAQLMPDERDPGSKAPWERGHDLTLMAAYYLARGGTITLAAETTTAWVQGKARVSSSSDTRFPPLHLHPHTTSGPPPTV